jgi:dihydroorotase
MSKYLLTKTQYQTLLEQSSNTAAMDLDIYSQPMTTSSDNGNSDVEDAVDDIISKMNELMSMLKSGKQIPTQLKTQIFHNLDEINKTFLNIKFEN